MSFYLYGINEVGNAEFWLMHVVVGIDNVLTTVFSNSMVVASIRLYCGEPIFLHLSTKIKARL